MGKTFCKTEKENYFILSLKTNFDNIFNGIVYVSTFVDD